METLRVVETLGVVKTMADTKVISQELFEVLPLAFQVCIGEHALLRNTRMQSSVPGRVLSDMTFRVGKKFYRWEVTIIPITDYILLGMNF